MELIAAAQVTPRAALSHAAAHPRGPRGRSGPTRTRPGPGWSASSRARSTTAACCERFLSWLARPVGPAHRGARRRLGPVHRHGDPAAGAAARAGRAWSRPGCAASRRRAATARCCWTRRRRRRTSTGPAPRPPCARGGTTTRSWRPSGPSRPSAASAASLDDRPGADGARARGRPAAAFPDRTPATWPARPPLRPGLLRPPAGDRRRRDRRARARRGAARRPGRRAARPPGRARCGGAAVTAPGQVRAHRRGVAVVAAVALVLVVLSVLSLGSAARGGDLDPDNPRGDGAQALARVLAGHGVDVTVVRRAAALERHPRRRGHHGAGHLDRDARAGHRAGARPAHGRGGGARARLARADRDPHPAAAADRRAAPAAATAPQAGCADALLAGLTVDTGPRPATRAAASAPVTGCFAAPGADAAARLSLVARVDRAAATYAVGAHRPVHQRPGHARRQRRRGAAAARRSDDRLVWYVPAVATSPPATPGRLRAQLPRWLRARPCGWWPLARGGHRRCGAAAGSGPLVIEPLPGRGQGRRDRRRAGAGSTAGSGDRAHAAARSGPPPRAGSPTRLRLGRPAPTTGALVATVAGPPAGPRRASPPADHPTPVPDHRPRPDRRWPTTWPHSTERYAAHERPDHDRTRRHRRPGGEEARAARCAAVRAEVAKAVVGQDAAVTGLVIALLCRGHVLLEGVPGVAKTLLVRTLAGGAVASTPSGCSSPPT